MEHGNHLSVELFGQRMLDAYSDSLRPYTGELIGVAYLFAQTGQVLEDIPEDTEGPQDEQQMDEIEEGEEEEGQDLDEGFQDLMFYLEGLLQNPIPQPPASTAQPQTEEAEEIVQLWQRLPERDKAPVSFPPRFRNQLTHGRFKKPKSSRAPTDSRAGVESLRRCLSSQGSGPAQSPGVSCLVKAICILLCKIFPQNRTFAGARISRWSDIVRNFGFIRENVLSHPMLSTKLQLFEINQKTLTQWFNKRKARQENVVLCVCQMDNIPPLTGDPQPAARRMAAPFHHAANVHVPTPHMATSASLVATATATPAASAPSAPAPSAPAPSAPAIVLPPPLPPPVFGIQTQRLPKTTAWKQKQLDLKKEEAERKGLAYVGRANFSCKCQLCKQPKTKAYGHSRFHSKKQKTMLHFCEATAGGQTVEELLSEKKREEDQL